MTASPGFTDVVASAGNVVSTVGAGEECVAVVVADAFPGML